MSDRSRSLFSSRKIEKLRYRCFLFLIDLIGLFVLQAFSWGTRRIFETSLGVMFLHRIVPTLLDLFPCAACGHADEENGTQDPVLNELR